MDGDFNTNDYHVKEYVPKDNIFEYYVGGGNSTNDKIAFKHPAIFPEKLVEDHIITWSNENDIIYDCFGGSGTTPKMSILNNRKWIMSEISQDYCDISEIRISQIQKG